MRGRVAGFDWDEGNWPKCGKHGMTKADIEHVLLNQPVIEPDRSGSVEPRFNAIGETAAGRFAFIVFTLRGSTVRPISARFMHAREIHHYAKS